ncbi:MAG: NAD-dependent epimerase/dehydratase family protein, partial [Chitinophagaceae bacterium]
MNSFSGIPAGSSVLVTGGAGFIGLHVCRALLQKGYTVIALDNLDPFYAPSIKLDNIADLRTHPGFQFVNGDIRDTSWQHPFPSSPKVIIHLAAKAGVRPSIQHPREYIDVNVQGTLSVLEYARQHKITKFIFGSSSSVYGVNPRVPWKESDTDLQPISPYAQSKIAAEELCRVYAHLYQLPVTVLRFFTVYGPAQRPDLAIHGFFSKIWAGLPISVFGEGATARDYTYVGDIVNGILSALEQPAAQDYRVYNLGNSHTIGLLELIRAIEEVAGKSAQIQYLPEQAGDVPITCADISLAKSELGYLPQTTLQ